MTNLACVSAANDFALQMLIIVLYSLAQDRACFQESLTCSFEGGLINLAITLDNVNGPTSAVAESGDLPGALV